MGFADQYAWSLNANSLQDDQLHFATEPLFAAAVADATGAGLGALLSRVKYADGSISKVFESGTQNLAQLIRVWSEIVVRKGQDRQWVKIRGDWDIAAAGALYKRVAARSLAHWLDGRCHVCHGSRSGENGKICQECSGTGTAPILGQGYEANLVRDMVSELEGILQSHNARAAARLRREP